MSGAGERAEDPRREADWLDAPPPLRVKWRVMNVDSVSVPGPARAKSGERAHRSSVQLQLMAGQIGPVFVSDSTLSLHMRVCYDCDLTEHLETRGATCDLG